MDWASYDDVSASLESPSKEQLAGGVISPKPGWLLGVFDFPGKFTEVKAWYDDVVSRAGRRKTH